MKIVILNTGVDISALLTGASWSGDINQAARQLDFTFVQSDGDKSIPVIEVGVGYTVVMLDDAGNVAFRGNIYDLERDRARAQVRILAYDNLFVLNKSKTTMKFENAYPQDITRSICSQMGVKTGKIATANVAVSFIANNKTGYQIIQGAYSEASKVNNKKYQQVMRGDELDVIEKGELSGVVADAAANMTDSVYKENIKNLINAVLITDEQGNGAQWITDNDSINRYSMFTAVYKTQKDKDSQTEARAMLNKPEREGVIHLLGDFRLKAGFSLIVRDEFFTGKFYIRQDQHNFKGGSHLTKLVLDFENVMKTEEVEKAK